MDSKKIQQKASEIYNQHYDFLNKIVDDLPIGYIKESCFLAIDLKTKGLPNINDTPPVKRLAEENYFQFWIGVKREVEKLFTDNIGC